MAVAVGEEPALGLLVALRRLLLGREDALGDRLLDGLAQVARAGRRVSVLQPFDDEVREVGAGLPEDRSWRDAVAAALADREDVVGRGHVEEEVRLVVDPFALDGGETHLLGLHLAAFVLGDHPVDLGAQGEEDVRAGAEDALDEPILDRRHRLPALAERVLAAGLLGRPVDLLEDAVDAVPGMRERVDEDDAGPLRLRRNRARPCRRRGCSRPRAWERA